MNAQVLVVDDDATARAVLSAAVRALGHDVVVAECGALALALLRDPAHRFDVVLLDVMMPVMDGYQTLDAIKAEAGLAHLPVIMASADDELDSVARCIELGAIDYLPKPVNRQVLAARMRASLAAKRLRDLELDHLEQVGRVIDAAGAIESGSYDVASLEAVAGRDDALGTLARVFARMAGEVAAREAALRRQVDELRVEIDQAQRLRQVAEVTESASYRQLADRAAQLKRILHESGPDGAAPDGAGRAG